MKFLFKSIKLNIMDISNSNLVLNLFNIFIY